ncbi:MAG: hypothetical protein N2491_00355 [Negativicutes bacterium]|nr:hypothetical protein [Negativicutes bacterium]
MDRPKWWRFFHPDLTLPIIVIAVFLFIIALGNLFGAYQSLFREKNLNGALLAGFSFFLYAAPAYGLLQLKRWARLFEIVLSLLLVALGMILVFSGLTNREFFYLATQGVIITVVHGSIAVYLLTERCRRVFGFSSGQKTEKQSATESEKMLNGK